MTTTADAGLVHATDEEHVAFGISESRVIFTQDQDFLRIHARGVPHAGIAFARQQTRTIGQIIDGLHLIWELMEPEEMQNRVEFL